MKELSGVVELLEGVHKQKERNVKAIHLFSDIVKLLARDVRKHYKLYDTSDILMLDASPISIYTKSTDKGLLVKLVNMKDGKDEESYLIDLNGSIYDLGGDSLLLVTDESLDMLAEFKCKIEGGGW